MQNRATKSVALFFYGISVFTYIIQNDIIIKNQSKGEES